jgi:hypothetical protein
MLTIYDWNDRSGTCVVEQNGKEFVLDLYGEGKCNAFFCAVWRKELQWFFLDEFHGKRMLGLTKCADGTKQNMLTKIKKITISKSNTNNWKKLLHMFVDAFDDIEIVIEK